MEQSILKSTKKILGVDPDDDSFDLDIMTHVNSAFSKLNDLGIGPREGFIIEDDTKQWADFFEGGTNHVWLSKVKTLIYLRVRLLFDPPSSSYHLNSLQEQIKEHEWHLNVNREAVQWRDPETDQTDVVVDDSTDVIIVDGGTA